MTVVILLKIKLGNLKKATGVLMSMKRKSTCLWIILWMQKLFFV